MSKLMFTFVLVCGAAIYNPEGLRDFAKYRAPELTWQFKHALLTVNRMLPSFIRFGRG